MSQSKFTYFYEWGRIGSTVFQIGARHTPSTTNVESFAVILFFELSDGTRVEVAKIDNSKHEEGEKDIHFDKYYREVGADFKEFDPDIDDCWEAEDELKENWEHYAQTYLQNHGEAPREDGINV